MKNVHVMVLSLSILKAARRQPQFRYEIALNSTINPEPAGISMSDSILPAPEFSQPTDYYNNFSSENVLLFEASTGESVIEQPYVCGFSFARRDAKFELSEEIASVYHDTFSSTAERLYWHLHRLAATTMLCPRMLSAFRVTKRTLRPSFRHTQTNNHT
ncbi:uncharacterized protein Z519_07776 [Cladophialophora bantiana CBS 173.52]|uniref:Uncharacterized protein n=1 Tax=Cladophialophora bantiana (strain ATCC 10958 / CBS 173.52 / CDC B-1940 / NIH 8579) TaxID=1442370 RepID=A0A0D2EP96_CLAB1|nr:uncharacterized protein Z519_07776 [Cladophialophora bantiana CBS 173.52]KIW91806.1 hypothetical protein Z519_07776 [Cladophialophora bantiana CBS 173.52]